MMARLITRLIDAMQPFKVRTPPEPLFPDDPQWMAIRDRHRKAVREKKKASGIWAELHARNTQLLRGR